MRLLLSGATGQIGDFTIPRLRNAGAEVVALSRNQHEARYGEEWSITDLLTDDPFGDAGAFDAWVHLGFLSLALPWLESAVSAGVTKFVAFSSTSIFTKTDSSSDKEQQTIGKLLDAESEVEKRCEALGINWVILRPTMIYGAGRDQNVAFVEAMIRRFGLFPLTRGGSGLRMPVHADDLAQAAVSALQTEVARNRAYNLGGGEVLSYRELVERVFTHLGKRSRFLPLPLPLARLLSKVASGLPGFGHVTPAMFERMSVNLVFDYSDAARDLGFNPRPFSL